MSKNRRDAKYIPETDPMHAIMPYFLPNRADNEAVIYETIDLTPIEQLIQRLNSDNPEYKYTFFHVICAAIQKLIYLRPRLNRYYSGFRLYERNDISLAFVIKRMFTDTSDEALCIIKADKESELSPLEQVYTKVKKNVYGVRKENKTDGATDTMQMLTVLPRPIMKLAVRLLDFLDYHDWYPKGLMEVDPYFATVFISNLGSIKLKAGYHHLANRGTNSIFVVIGEKKPKPIFDADGSYKMKNSLSLGITIDERIADGYYFSKSIKLLKHMLENPELLMTPFSTEINIEN